VTVDYAVTGGTATGGGTDYTLTAGTATITAGSTKTDISVEIVDDALDEPDETIIVTISNPVNATLGTNTTHTYTIGDNDPEPTVSFTAAPYSHEETGTQTVTVALSAQSGKEVTVDYATSDGTATAGSDYTGASGTVTWAIGQTGAKTFAVTILEDALDEGDETVTLTLSSPGNCTIAGDNPTTLTITDDDPAPTVEFTSASSRGAESVSPADLELSLSQVSGLDVTVDYAVTGGTATGGGTDYTLAAGSATITAGSTKTDISVEIVDDASDEPDETITVTISNPVNAELGTNTTHTYTIEDNDAEPTVSFTAAPYTHAETGTQTVSVTLSAESGKEVPVSYATSDGTASAGSDYTGASGTVTWAIGQTGAKTFAVTILEDALDEGDETVTLTLSSPGNCTIAGDNPTTLTIEDDDTANITVEPTSGLTTTETEGEATFTVVLTSEPMAGVSVDLSTSDGTEGTVSLDSLTFDSTNWSTAQTVTVTGVDDDVVDGDITYSIVTAAAVSLDPNYSGIDPADVAVTNEDDDTNIYIMKTVDTINPNVDDEVVFTIVVTNSGPKDATAVQVIDILPSGLSYVSDDSPGSYDPNTGIWNIGNLSATPPDNVASLNITAEVIQEGEIVNIASITTYPDSSNNSSGMMLNGGIQADLGIWKTVDNPKPNAGDTITFTITLTNNGLDDATGVHVTDVLPTGLTYKPSMPSQGTYDPDTGVWDVEDLNVGDSATLQLAVTVNSADEITNTASITHNQIDPDTTNNESSVVINTVHPSIADLAIQKMVNQSEVSVGDEIVFTLLVRNNGPDDANNLQIDDVLPDGLTYISSEPSQGSYDDEQGMWDIGTISATSYVIMDIVAEVIDAGPQTNIASVSNVDEFDPNNENDSDKVTVAGLAADISVQKAVDNEEPRAGDSVVFTITVSNNGPNDATEVQVIDQLPSGLIFKSGMLSGGTYDPDTGVWDVGDLTNEASATLQITAKVDRSGDIANTASRTASAPTDMDSDNDTGSVTINVPYDGDGDGMPDEWEVGYGLDPWTDDTGQDPDEDGLSNLGEYENGTDPTNWDTDNDDLPDGWEVSNGIDPLDNVGDNGRDGDFDNDGWTNYEEYINGTNPADHSSPVPTPPEIIEAIPHHDAGISDDTRVPNDTSFCVLIEDSDSGIEGDDGIDITDTSSIKFTIDDSVNPVYERDLSDTTVVRVIKLTSDSDNEVTKLWAVYDRSTEATYGNYFYDTTVNIKVDAQDRRDDWMTQASYDFGIETESEHNNAQANLQDTGPVDPYDPALEGSYDTGIQVNSGDLEGAKIIFDSSEPVAPTFGPTNEVPALDIAEVEAVGVPMNLQPPTVFNTPVKIFIPCSDYTDVSGLSVYLYHGTEWVLACDASGNVQPGGEGWIVPGSRVNHNDGTPSTIEIQLYHFSGVQAATGNQPPTASFTADPTSGEAPLRVSFDATASSDPDGTIESYIWDFGDGSTGSGETTSHEYTSAGTYTATLTVTDADGAATDTTTATITVTEPAPPSGGGEGGGGGIGCFIATAAYGSPMEPHVKVLRQFRDRFLLTNLVGRAFVDLYNTYSQPVADFIGRDDRARSVVRWSLLPLVGVTWVALRFGLWVTVALIGLLICVMVAATTVTLSDKAQT
jgi:uncharacterized repeat protein (TIGR01451 family)